MGMLDYLDQKEAVAELQPLTERDALTGYELAFRFKKDSVRIWARSSDGRVVCDLTATRYGNGRWMTPGHRGHFLKQGKVTEYLMRLAQAAMLSDQRSNASRT